MTRSLNFKLALSDGTSKTFSIPNPKLDSSIEFPEGIFGTEDAPREDGVISKIRNFAMNILKDQGLGSAWEPKVLKVEDCKYVFEYEKEVASKTESWEEESLTPPEVQVGDFTF